jgi:hypothetical protein
MGKTVLQSKLNAQLGQYVVNTKGWTEGVYTFRIALGETQITFAGKFEVVH